jgi:hypothetical protein
VMSALTTWSVISQLSDGPSPSPPSATAPAPR